MAFNLAPGETTGVFLSGGADSALLFYLLARENRRIVLLTVASEQRDYNVTVARDIVRWVTERTDCVIVDHAIVIAPTEAERREMRLSVVEQLNSKHSIDVWFTGKTRNPPVKLDYHEDRKPDRDGELTEGVGKHRNPLCGIDKSQVLEIYRSCEAMRLFNMTVSCETSSTPCGACWWCMEREWAINESARNRS
jgi:7-cyano-7-deazaguanine synthase in queuosine biosynthesis